MKKCKKCGSTQFIVNEQLSHDAELINGVMEVNKNVSNEIEKIFCKKCGWNCAEGDEDFDINFNW